MVREKCVNKDFRVLEILLIYDITLNHNLYRLIWAAQVQPYNTLTPFPLLFLPLGPRNLVNVKGHPWRCVPETL